jgi:hypothetical protein
MSVALIAIYILICRYVPGRWVGAGEVVCD